VVILRRNEFLQLFLAFQGSWRGPSAVRIDGRRHLEVGTHTGDLGVSSFQNDGCGEKEDSCPAEKDEVARPVSERSLHPGLCDEQ
jgi:hypothetical protein